MRKEDSSKYELIEWKHKASDIKILYDYTCQDCNTQFKPQKSTNITVREVSIDDWIEIVDQSIEEYEEFQRNFKGLQVHHLYYISVNGELIDPWAYPNEALIPLCVKCHKERHRIEKIPIYRR